MKTQYKGTPREEFSLNREMDKNYGVVPAPKSAERVAIPAHLDASKGTTKTNLNNVVGVIKQVIDSKIEQIVHDDLEAPKREVPFSRLDERDAQYLGLPDVERALDEEPDPQYQGAASEGDIEAVQCRAEGGSTYLLHEIKEDDETEEDSD